MGMVDQAVINFACYEDAKDFLGLASVTLPDVDFIVATVSGAGIAGNVEAPIIGHMNAMTAQLKFRTFSAESLKLLEPREHNIDLRAPRQVYDPIAGVYKTQSVKHVLVLFPKAESNGKSSCLFRRRCRTAISPRRLPRTALAATPCVAG